MVDIDLSHPLKVATYFITTINELQKSVVLSNFTQNPKQSPLQASNQNTASLKHVSFSFPQANSKPMLPSQVANPALLAPINKYPTLIQASHRRRAITSGCRRRAKTDTRDTELPGSLQA